jgi:hypothetical protein
MALRLIPAQTERLTETLSIRLRTTPPNTKTPHLPTQYICHAPILAVFYKEKGEAMSKTKTANIEQTTTKWTRRLTISFASVKSINSILSILSLYSAGSILSIGSVGSILSIGSAGSILSIGSVGSILSIGSSGTILGIGSVSLLHRKKPFSS